MRFRAAEALEQAGLSPERIRAVLPRVDTTRLWVRPASRWFRLFWGPGITAVAMPWGIYVHPRRLAGGAGGLGPLIVHEIAHIEQWRRLGAVGWARSYLGDYLRGRRSGMAHDAAYRSIGLEVEARDVARSLAGG